MRNICVGCLHTGLSGYNYPCNACNDGDRYELIPNRSQEINELPCCKGTFDIGDACGKCSKCLETKNG